MGTVFLGSDSVVTQSAALHRDRRLRWLLDADLGQPLNIAAPHLRLCEMESRKRLPLRVAVTHKWFHLH